MSQAEQKRPLPEEALPAPLDRDQLWTTAALQGELDKLAHLPEGENVNKADSSFYASLVKIAAIIKGSGRMYATPGDTLIAVKQACQQYPWLKEKEVERQWRNAYNFAEPRYRRDEKA